MNYRHAYHAGAFSDVFKHSILTLILQALRKKDAPFCAIDTHAGIGRYDLAGVEAGKTGEAETGVRRLEGKSLPKPLRPYWRAVKALNKRTDRDALRWYPGSPRVTRQFLREQDRLQLAELHPDDAATLAEEFRGDDQVRVHAMDGYTAMKALLPPPERRGVVLIDPPFEVTDEFAQLQRGLTAAWKRWPTGIYAIWFPVKAWEPVLAFRNWFAETAPGPTLCAQLLVHPADTEERLNGCGMIIVRPPWKLDEEVEQLLPALLALLDQGGGETELTWLLRESAQT